MAELGILQLNCIFKSKLVHSSICIILQHQFPAQHMNVFLLL